MSLGTVVFLIALALCVRYFLKQKERHHKEDLEMRAQIELLRAEQEHARNMLDPEYSRRWRQRQLESILDLLENPTLEKYDQVRLVLEDATTLQDTAVLRNLMGLDRKPSLVRLTEQQHLDRIRQLEQERLDQAIANTLRQDPDYFRRREEEDAEALRRMSPQEREKTLEFQRMWDEEVAKAKGTNT